MSTTYKSFLFFTISCAMALFLSSCGSESSQIEMVTADEAELLLAVDNVQLVDVRTLEEYEEGFIENAIHISSDDENLESLFNQKLNSDQPVLLYCKKGGRSAKCAKLLEEKGFTKIYELEGGFSEWTSQGKKFVLKNEIN